MLSNEKLCSVHDYYLTRHLMSFHYHISILYWKTNSIILNKNLKLILKNLSCICKYVGRKTREVKLPSLKLKDLNLSVYVDLSIVNDL